MNSCIVIATSSGSAQNETTCTVASVKLTTLKYQKYCPKTNFYQNLFVQSIWIFAPKFESSDLLCSISRQDLVKGCVRNQINVALKMGNFKGSQCVPEILKLCSKVQYSENLKLWIENFQIARFYYLKKRFLFNV